MPDPKVHYNSVVYGLKDFSPLQKVLYYITFILVPFQPLIGLITKPQNKGWRRTTFFVTALAFLVLLLAGLFFSDYFLRVLQDLGQKLTGHDLAIKVLVITGVLLVNVVCYIVYLVFDFHNILADAFGSSTKTQLDRCFEEILGHKLWSGTKTYKFLEFLLQQSMRLGRSKWLLVNFLRDGIENSIHKDEVTIKKDGDEETRLVPEYKIKGSSWDVYDYSLYLKQNLTHAENSVHWLVDPKDFLYELIPSYLTEAIVSIGMCLHDTSWNRVKPLLQENSESSYSIHELLKKIGLDHDLCPWNTGGICNRTASSSTKCLGANCKADGLKWDKEAEAKKTMLNCFFAIFFGLGLRDLKETAEATKKTLKIGNKTINSDKILKQYENRADIIEDYCLPHIFEFKNLAIKHKCRNIFLGLSGDALKNIVKKNQHFGSPAQYCQMIYPRIKLTGEEVCSIEEDGCFVNGQADEAVNTKYTMLWDAVGNMEVFDILLGWSYSLFVYSSGGKNHVNGVSVNEPPLRKTFDLGVYDSCLVIDSKPPDQKNTRTRKIGWTLYNFDSSEISKIMTTFFPSSGNNLFSSERVEEKLIDAFHKKTESPTI